MISRAREAADMILARRDIAAQATRAFMRRALKNGRQALPASAEEFTKAPYQLGHTAPSE